MHFAFHSEASHPFSNHNRSNTGGFSMYNLLVKLMLITALVHLGICFKDFQNCHSRQCTQLLEKRSRDVLRVDWKPISVFPEDARRFR
jgi:hypothetical protein